MLPPRQKHAAGVHKHLCQSGFQRTTGLHGIPAINAHEVLRDPANLNEEPLSLEEMGKRGQGVLDSGLPFLVAGMEG